MKSKHHDPTQNSSSSEKWMESQESKEIKHSSFLRDRLSGGLATGQSGAAGLCPKTLGGNCGPGSKQWAEVDSRYSDIPYIECDVP